MFRGLKTAIVSKNADKLQFLGLYGFGHSRPPVTAPKRIARDEMYMTNQRCLPLEQLIESS